MTPIPSMEIEGKFLSKHLQDPCGLFSGDRLHKAVERLVVSCGWQSKNTDGSTGR